jgi:prepilin-type N-terminal cleavage/methylation domain-containing protein
MAKKRNGHNRAFSLLELVIVVAIIAIIAAIGIPRMSRGTRGAGDSALSGNLAVLRNAIDLYKVEHGGTDPNTSAIADQLTKYTDASGNTSDTKDTTYYYGPYIRKIPPLPVGDKKSCTGIAAGTGDGVGWIYTESTGDIKANCVDTELDDAGKQYNQY